ncbi:hypothetical protein [Bacillus thuringiensis]|uniref:hypothetical protein n=1 Tax=Bacillus thuringiensis TaxID=1428 RepID=UPI0020161CBF|nr:hypothetical protein [Bacillus thuringiensis]
MKVTVVNINMTEIIAPFIAKGEWVAFEGKDYTMFAAVGFYRSEWRYCIIWNVG